MKADERLAEIREELEQYGAIREEEARYLLTRTTALEALVPDEELLRQLGHRAAKMSEVYDRDGQYHLAQLSLGNSVKAESLAAAIRKHREAGG